MYVPAIKVVSCISWTNGHVHACHHSVILSSWRLGMSRYGCFPAQHDFVRGSCLYAGTDELRMSKGHANITNDS